MKNADMPAMPVNTSGEQWNGMADFDGLTKREMFAMHAMQGILCSSQSDLRDMDIVAKRSIKAADELLKELEK